MNFDIEKFAEGVRDLLAIHKSGASVFDNTGGNIFPHHTSQKTWEYARKGGHIHFTDGTHTYSFKGDLSDVNSDLSRVADIPLPEIFSNAESRGKAQVHRSDPGSIYFTMQEGRSNPTYTFRHEGDSRWKAIPKPRKLKQKLEQPVTPPNVNLEQVKAGMLAELEQFVKEAQGEPLGFFNQANHALGRGVEGLASLPKHLAMWPATIGGAVTHYGDNNQNATESFGKSVGNAALSGAIGAGAGGLYHLLKRDVINTPEENAEEDAEGNTLLKRMAVPGMVMGGLNYAGRSMFPRYINNPEIR